MQNMDAEKVLQILSEKGEFDSLQISKDLSVDHQKVVGAIKSLECLGDYIKSEQRVTKTWELTAEGRSVAENGSHEAHVYEGVPASSVGDSEVTRGILQSDLMSSVPNAKVGFSKAMSNGWIQMIKPKAADGSTGKPRVIRKVDSIVDQVQRCCQMIAELKLDDITDQQKNEYKKRKLITELKLTSFVVWKGEKFSLTVEKPETDLTPEMIQSGSWKQKTFKPYNFSALGVQPASGHLHPLLKVRTQFRQIFLEMGFSEMPTNNYVESSFWNFDSLFQPQQHPARDAHDTFFVSDPEYAVEFPEDYLERVRTVHSEGGYGSQGYRYDWKKEEASKNIMRTHTTAVSARMLYKLAQQILFRDASTGAIGFTLRLKMTTERS